MLVRIPLVILCLLVPMVGSASVLAEPSAPDLQTSLVFTLPTGGVSIQHLGSLNPEYTVERDAEGVTVRVFDEEGVATRSSRLLIEPSTPFVEIVDPIGEAVPAVLPSSDFSVSSIYESCNTSVGYCADLGVNCGWGCTTYHGMSVWDTAPSTAPNNVFYKYACDSGWSCTIHLETWHHDGTNYGSLHCYKHSMPPEADLMYVWTQINHNGAGLPSGAWTTNQDTNSC